MASQPTKSERNVVGYAVPCVPIERTRIDIRSTNRPGSKFATTLLIYLRQIPLASLRHRKPAVIVAAAAALQSRIHRQGPRPRSRTGKRAQEILN